MEDIGGAEDWLDSWVADVNTHSEQAAELSDRVAVLTGVAQNLDGAVKIRVGSGGQVLGLYLDDSACDLGGRHLAEEIMSVMHAAQADMCGGVSDAVAATVGVHTETGRAILDALHARFPPPPATCHDGGLGEDDVGDLRVVR